MSITLLRSYVRTILVEGKIDDLKLANPTLVSDIDKLVNSIPLKYLGWAVKQLKTKSQIDDVITALRFFMKNEKYFVNSDIYSYKTLAKLQDEIDSLDQNSLQSKRETTKEIKSSGTEKIYTDSQHDVLYVKTKSASVCYGMGTKWCISMQDAFHWEEYADKNVVFYFVIDKLRKPNDKYHKIAIAITRDIDYNTYEDQEIWDAEDKPIATIPAELNKLNLLLPRIIKDSYKRESSSILVRLQQGKVSDQEIKKMISDNDEDLLTSIIFDIPKAYLPLLMHSEIPGIQSTIADRIDLKYLPQMMAAPGSGTRQAVARRIDPVHLPKMMNDESWYVRRDVAKRISPEYFSEMENDEKEGVRIEIEKRRTKTA